MGEGFYPDFILICEYKKEQIHYQVFLEPKGKGLGDSPKEKSKQDFLLSIKNDITLNKDIFELDTDKYILAGIVGMLLFQQIQNIGMTVGLLPITGITLPFISYGGSSLLSYMILVGIILNISMEKAKHYKYK